MSEDQKNPKGEQHRMIPLEYANPKQAKLAIQPDKGLSPGCLKAVVVIIAFMLIMMSLCVLLEATCGGRSIK